MCEYQYPFLQLFHASNLVGATRSETCAALHNTHCPHLLFHVKKIINNNKTFVASILSGGQTQLSNRLFDSHDLNSC